MHLRDKRHSWLAVLAVGLLAACGGGSNNPATPTPAITASPTTMPEPTPAARFETYPIGTTSGVPIVDRFIAIAEDGTDTVHLAAMLAYQPVPCTTEPRQDGVIFPPCAEGQPDGTKVDAFVTTRCQGAWSSRPSDPDGYIFLGSYLTRYLAPRMAVMAIARLAPPARPVEDGGRPAGEYLVILQPFDDSGPSDLEMLVNGVSGERRAAVLSDEGIVELRQGCEFTNETYIDDDGLDSFLSLPIAGFILPPMPR